MAVRSLRTLDDCEGTPTAMQLAPLLPMAAEPVQVEISNLSEMTESGFPWLGVISAVIALGALFLNWRVSRANHKRWEKTEAANRERWERSEKTNRERWAGGVKLEVYSEVLTQAWNSLHEAALLINSYAKHPNVEKVWTEHFDNMIQANNELAALDNRLRLVAPKYVCEQFAIFRNVNSSYISGVSDSLEVQINGGVNGWAEDLDQKQAKSISERGRVEIFMTFDLGVEVGDDKQAPELREKLKQIAEGAPWAFHETPVGDGSDEFRETGADNA